VQLGDETPHLVNLQFAQRRVNGELERVIRESYERIAQISRSRQLPLRTSAYVLAIGRVGKATVLRGI